MSGGSMNYLYSRIETDAIFKLDTNERRAFRKLLDNVTEALRCIEWVDSDDSGKGSENEAIRACFSEGILLKTAIEEAKECLKSLQFEIELASNALRTA